MAAISFGPIFNPPVPFSTHLNHGFTNGTLVMIGGSVPLSADRFDLNFKCGPAENDDIAFHFNPHFDEGLVVCNTMERNKWGKEEHKHELPFRKGHPFELWILITYHDYKVSVNRRHFLQYRHRIPVHRVNTLTVTGCISLTSIEILAQGPAYPMQPEYFPHPFPPSAGCRPLIFNPGHYEANYTVPFQTDIYGGLFPNKRIIIKGAVINHANRFHASLKFSGGIAFYFNPRFDEHSIIRNSFVHNSWGREERQLPICGMCFVPGQNFLMEIISEPLHYRVVVNGNHLCNFNHRMPRLQQIDSLLIEGDVVLQHVQV